MPSKSVLYFARRLRDNRDAAADRLVIVESRCERMREEGVDTSTYDRRSSAQPPDHTLAQVRGRLDFAQRELDKYLVRHGLVESDLDQLTEVGVRLD